MALTLKETTNTCHQESAFVQNHCMKIVSASRFLEENWLKVLFELNSAILWYCEIERRQISTPRTEKFAQVYFVHKKVRLLWQFCMIHSSAYLLVVCLLPFNGYSFWNVHAYLCLVLIHDVVVCLLLMFMLMLYWYKCFTCTRGFALCIVDIYNHHSYISFHFIITLHPFIYWYSLW